MRLEVSDQAVQWFKKELELESGDYIKFYVRYGGYSPIQEGFSLGLTKEEPEEAGETFEKDGFLFYIEKADLWYLKDYNLVIEYDEKKDDINYRYNN